MFLILSMSLLHDGLGVARKHLAEISVWSGKKLPAGGW
jgi:hypothetical protein